MTMDRRRFLQLTAAGMVASITSSSCSPDASKDARALTDPELLEMLGPERVQEIGTRYRAAAPKENTASALRAAIAESERRRFPLIGKRSTEEQIRDDFAAGQTVVVNGWVLSTTEARQCALYSLVVQHS